jgi:hypothetical protein
VCVCVGFLISLSLNILNVLFFIFIGFPRGNISALNIISFSDLTYISVFDFVCSERTYNKHILQRDYCLLLLTVLELSYRYFTFCKLAISLLLSGIELELVLSNSVGLRKYLKIKILSPYHLAQSR